MSFYFDENNTNTNNIICGRGRVIFNNNDIDCISDIILASICKRIMVHLNNNFNNLYDIYTYKTQSYRNNLWDNSCNIKDVSPGYLSSNNNIFTLPIKYIYLSMLNRNEHKRIIALLYNRCINDNLSIPVFMNKLFNINATFKIDNDKSDEIKDSSLTFNKILTFFDDIIRNLYKYTFDNFVNILTNSESSTSIKDTQYYRLFYNKNDSILSSEYQDELKDIMFKPFYKITYRIAYSYKKSKNDNDNNHKHYIIIPILIFPFQSKFIIPVVDISSEDKDINFNPKIKFYSTEYNNINELENFIKIKMSIVANNMIQRILPSIGKRIYDVKIDSINMSSTVAIGNCINEILCKFIFNDNTIKHIYIGKDNKLFIISNSASIPKRIIGDSSELVNKKFYNMRNQSRENESFLIKTISNLYNKAFKLFEFEENDIIAETSNKILEIIKNRILSIKILNTNMDYNTELSKKVLDLLKNELAFDKINLSFDNLFIKWDNVNKFIDINYILYFKEYFGSQDWCIKLLSNFNIHSNTQDNPHNSSIKIIDCNKNISSIIRKQFLKYRPMDKEKNKLMNGRSFYSQLSTIIIDIFSDFILNSNINIKNNELEKINELESELINIKFYDFLKQRPFLYDDIEKNLELLKQCNNLSLNDTMNNFIDSSANNINIDDIGAENFFIELNYYLGSNFNIIPVN